MTRIIDLRASTVVGVFLCGVLSGAVLILPLLAKSFAILPGKAEYVMSYTDLVTILLACVAIIITVFGVMIAILAFWGYGNMARQAKASAAKAVEESLKEGGSLHSLAMRTLLKMTYGQIGIAESSGDQDPLEKKDDSDD